MIKKLMKYDIKKMIKILLYIYAISLILAIITRLINIGKNIQFIAIIGSFFAGFTYSAVASILINCVIHVLMTFRNGFYKDESYLTHTLPVTKNQLLNSKYLSGLLVFFTSFIVSLLSLFIVLYSDNFVQGLKLLLQSSFSNLSIPMWLVISLIAILFFAEFWFLMSISFCAIVKANTYNTKRVRRGLIWFFTYYLISVFVMFALIFLIFAITGDLQNLFAEKLSQGMFITLLISSIIEYIAFGVISYFYCKYLFNKGVNVD